MGVTLMKMLMHAESSKTQPFNAASPNDPAYGLFFRSDSKQYFELLKTAHSTPSYFEDRSLVDLLSSMLIPTPNLRPSAKHILQTSKWLRGEEVTDLQWRRRCSLKRGDDHTQTWDTFIVNAQHLLFKQGINKIISRSNRFRQIHNIPEVSWIFHQ